MPFENFQQNGMPTSDTMEDLSSAISFLISKGADMNVRDIYGQTPLHYAAMRGNEVACRELIGYPEISLEVFVLCFALVFSSKDFRQAELLL